MKITDVKTVLLTGPSTNDPFLLECRRRRSAAFIEIHSDVGVTGTGETYAGYFCPEMVPEVVRFFEPILVGQNVDDIDRLWRHMYHCGNFWCRVGLGAIVLNGIEAALWDLKGKLEDVPVHELLGGLKHQSLDCYATGGPANFPPDRLAKKIEHYESLGFKGLKVGVGWYGNGWIGASSAQEWIDSEAEKLQFVRSRFGYDLDLMLDAHMGNSPVGTWDLPTATAVAKALEPFDLKFLEEPLTYCDPTGYSELCKKTTVPIAGGECLTTAYEWKVFSDQDAFDIGQPDASFTGGLSEFMKVAAMLDTRGRTIATHSWGAGGSLMQNIHCGFAASNTCILEVAPDFGPLHSEIISDPVIIKNGKVQPPRAPGLGIELSDDIKRRFRFVPGSGEFNDVPGKILVD